MVMRKLTKIISGGQTGVDQAALRAANDSGLETGGWCPPGRVCESGKIPMEFPLKETERERSPDAPDVPRSQRTEWNVRDSDATLILRAPNDKEGDAGTIWTAQCAKRYGRPLLLCDIGDPKGRNKVQQWLARLPIRILNVAGPSESTAPGIGGRAYTLLKRAFEEL
jgi:hypothetical protein